MIPSAEMFEMDIILFFFLIKSTTFVGDKLRYLQCTNCGKLAYILKPNAS